MHALASILKFEIVITLIFSQKWWVNKKCRYDFHPKKSKFGVSIIKSTEGPAPETSKQGAKESASDGSTDESKIVGPRDNALKDEAYFMAVALVSAERSKDPSRQVDLYQ